MSDSGSNEQAETNNPGSQQQLKGIIEALLFASDRTLTSSQLAELSGAADGREARKAVLALQKEYEETGRAFRIEEVAGGFRLVTRPEYHQWVSKLRRNEQIEGLSQAALETLAIVAYRQPIVRSEIEDIRGVQSDYILRSLMEKGLVRVCGRSEELGRPLLYGTTRKFLEMFALRSLDDLPDIKELTGREG